MKLYVFIYNWRSYSIFLYETNWLKKLFHSCSNYCLQTAQNHFRTMRQDIVKILKFNKIEFWKKNKFRLKTIAFSFTNWHFSSVQHNSGSWYDKDNLTVQSFQTVVMMPKTVIYNFHYNFEYYFPWIHQVNHAYLYSYFRPFGVTTESCYLYKTFSDPTLKLMLL